MTLSVPTDPIINFQDVKIQLYHEVFLHVLIDFVIRTVYIVNDSNIFENISTIGNVSPFSFILR